MTRLSTQIDRATAILSSDDLPPGEVAQWRAQSKVFLEDALGSLHEYVHRFEMGVIAETRSNIEAGRGVLKAIWEDASAGHLKFRGLPGQS